MRYTQIITDLSHISFVTIFHHAGPADHFQVGDPRQLGQNVVLHTIDEGSGVFSLPPSVGRRDVLLASVFKWQNGDSSC
jgi:hypothetical protein